MPDEETSKAPRRRPRARQGERDGGADGGTDQRAEQADEGGDGGDSAATRRAGAWPERQVPLEQEEGATQDERTDDVVAGPAAGLAASAARQAMRYVAGMTRCEPESVVSVERRGEEWEIGVEVVEVHRIPDTADILAVYEVRLRPDGELESYRRVRRYARGQLDRRSR